MSYQAMAWATDQKLPSTQKLVLLMLANRINNDTGKCIPSIKRLAEDCGLSESCVQRTLKKLSDIGLLKVYARFNDGVQLPNQYEINQNLSATPGVPDTPPRCTSATPRVDVERTEPGSLTSNITNTPCNPPEGESLTDGKKKKPKSEAVALKTFIAQCKERGEQAIPENDTVFSTAEKIGIPVEFLHIAWFAFKRKYIGGTRSEKRYVRWRQVFSDAVESNYLKLWWFGDSGCELNSAGKSMKKLMESEEAHA